MRVTDMPGIPSTIAAPMPENVMNLTQPHLYCTSFSNLFENNLLYYDSLGRLVDTQSMRFEPRRGKQKFVVLNLIKPLSEPYYEKIQRISNQNLVTRSNDTCTTCIFEKIRLIMTFNLNDLSHVHVLTNHFLSRHHLKLRQYDSVLNFQISLDLNKKLFGGFFSDKFAKNKFQKISPVLTETNHSAKK